MSRKSFILRRLAAYPFSKPKLECGSKTLLFKGKTREMELVTPFTQFRHNACNRKSSCLPLISHTLITPASRAVEAATGIAVFVSEPTFTVR
jgi:hypothetical protein